MPFSQKFLEEYAFSFIDIFSETCRQERIQLDNKIKEEIIWSFTELFKAKNRRLQLELLKGVEERKIERSVFLAYNFQNSMNFLVDSIMKNIKNEERERIMFGDFLVALVEVGKKCGFWPIC